MQMGLEFSRNPETRDGQRSVMDIT